MKICKSPYCTNIAAPNRNFCWKCVKRNYRSNNPIKSAYYALRDNAKRRGKLFDLSFSEFKSFCIETDYIAGKGRTKTSFTIDRIDCTKGYHISNIQILEHSANDKKGAIEKKILQTYYDDIRHELTAKVKTVRKPVDNFVNTPF